MVGQTSDRIRNVGRVIPSLPLGLQMLLVLTHNHRRIKIVKTLADHSRNEYAHLALGLACSFG